MSADMAGSTRLEQLLAWLLHYGTWVASGVVTLGMGLALAERYGGGPFSVNLTGTRVLSAGIALFILLPVSRVALMLLVFARERDYRYVLIAALVLTIILVAFACGVLLPSASQGGH